MKPRHSTFLCFLITAFLVLVFTPQTAEAQTPEPVVQVVLFYSPYCSHCIYVLTEFMPGMFDQYGSQLKLFTIDVTRPEATVLYRDAVTALDYPGSSVPFLVVDDTYLVGDVDIPAQFPALMDTLLALGGTSWPELPGLAEYMSNQENTQLATLGIHPPASPGETETSDATATTISSLMTVPTPVPSRPVEEPGDRLAEVIARDSPGNSLAIGVLVGMLFACVWATWYLLKKPGFRLTGITSWSILVLCLVGLGIAGYLSYVETQQVDAYCGIVGDCNTVQQSESARLFSILPVGILGILGFVLILLAWCMNQCGRGKWSDYAALAQMLLTIFATLFSLYLTFLEPFVIGATCLWCLSSAVISTILMLLSLPPGKLASQNLFFRKL